MGRRENQGLAMDVRELALLTSPETDTEGLRPM